MVRTRGELIDSIDINKIFNHIKYLEGIRHPMTATKSLEDAREYISSKFEEYGYNTNQLTISLDADRSQYYNIEAFDSEDTIYRVLITSHFDTVYNSPGADDNASAVAAMLEIARVAKKYELSQNLRFVCFNLEEGNPTVLQKTLQVGKKFNFIDDNFSPNSHRIVKIEEELTSYIHHISSNPSKNILEEAFHMMNTKLTPEEYKYLRVKYQAYSTSTSKLWKSLGQNNQKTGLRGSAEYCNYLKENRITVAGVINLESIGYTTNQEYSQNTAGLPVEKMPKHGTISDLSIGDFLLIISDINSKELGAEFFEDCKISEIDLPSSWLHLPMDYEGIIGHLPDALRSDHAPFWYHNIPAILITDTANFRNPYYHTLADTIETLDFEFIKKITQTTLICSLRLSDQEIPVKLV